MLKIPFIPKDDSLSIIDKGAHIRISSVNWPDAQQSNPVSECFACHDGTTLKLLFRVNQPIARAVNGENQSPVSQDSCVEAFFQPEDCGEYWNFEFNCIGAVNGSHRHVRPNPTRLTDAEIATIGRTPSLGTEPFGERVCADAWTLLLEIPLAIMGIDASAGATLRGNFYSCSSKSAKPNYLSWNPINTENPDFHRTEYFGKIELEAISESGIR